MLLLAAATLYLAVAGLVWLMQESLIFYPRAAGPRPPAPQGWRIEAVSFTTRDATTLAGVLAMPPLERAPLVIYFGGNAEEVTSYASEAALTYGPRAVLFVNYRGYGASGGRPGERSLVSDGLELFDWAAKRSDIDATRIAVHGRSLGTGVAVQVAAARPVKCVVLTSPFDSALDVARSMYWWLPISWMMRHPFDSTSRAPKLAMPALILTGSADTLIPEKHSRRLAAAWGGPVERVSLEGFGHNDLDLSPRYRAAIHAFLDRCL